MSMFILIGDDYFNIDAIACIRPTDDDQTVLFTTGQPATDGGFLIDLPVEEVFAMVQSARLLEIGQMMADENGTGNEPELESEPGSEP